MCLLKRERPEQQHREGLYICSRFISPSFGFVILRAQVVLKAELMAVSRGTLLYDKNRWFC